MDKFTIRTRSVQPFLSLSLYVTCRRTRICKQTHYRKNGRFVEVKIRTGTYRLVSIAFYSRVARIGLFFRNAAAVTSHATCEVSLRPLPSTYMYCYLLPEELAVNCSLILLSWDPNSLSSDSLATISICHPSSVDQTQRLYACAVCRKCHAPTFVCLCC